MIWDTSNGADWPRLGVCEEDRHIPRGGSARGGRTPRPGAWLFAHGNIEGLEITGLEPQCVSKRVGY